VSSELSQEYVDELVATEADQGALTQGSEATPAAAAHARLFERTKRFSRQVLVLTEALHTQFAQEIAFYLSTHVGARATMSVTGIEELAPQEFNQFLETSSEHTLVAVFEFQNNPGVGVFQLETSIALPIYERMCGGMLGGVDETRKLTDIEFAVVRRIVEHIVTELYPAAWEPVIGLSIILQRIQTGREATFNLMDPWAVILITLELSVGSDTGAVYISLPYAMLEPFLDSMEAKQPLTGGSKAVQEKYQALLRSALRSVEIPLEVMLGQVDLSLQDFSSLNRGDIIILGDAETRAMPVTVGGRTKYLARPGRLGPNAAIRVDKVLAEEGEV